jgi:hypothetical protein
VFNPVLASHVPPPFSIRLMADEVFGRAIAARRYT